jgi:hypothetical protein
MCVAYFLRTVNGHVALGFVATVLITTFLVAEETNPLRQGKETETAPQGQSSPDEVQTKGSRPPGQLSPFYDGAVSQAAYSYPGQRRPFPGRVVRDPRWAINFGDEQVEILLDDSLGEGELIEGPLLQHEEDCLGCSKGCLIPCPGNWLDRVDLFAGVQGSTGPANRGEMGSFGFYEGANWGAPVGCLPWEIGSQVGASWTQSHFGGAAFSPSSRDQLFVTGGLFRRADWGLQGGVVVDYLRDQWYFDNELVQIRGEVSWINPCAHELGFRFAANAKDSLSVSTVDAVDIVEEWETTDLYTFFYRRRLEDCGATASLFVGFSGDSDAVIGANADIPLSDRWALRTGFTYLIPEESSPGQGFLEEVWNVSTGLVFYPGCRTARGKDYNHPLFNVADNGSMLLERK